MQPVYHIRETVGVFSDHPAMQQAVMDLGAAGFGRHQISVLGSEQAMKEKFGVAHLHAETLEDNPEAPRSNNIAPQEVGIAQGVLVGGGIYTGMAAAVIAAGGIMAPAAIISAVVMGASGGLIGALLARLLGHEYAKFFEKQVESGGVLLWVQTPTAAEESVARAILEKYGARDVHVHELSPTTHESAA